jgi:hypothetical protein
LLSPNERGFSPSHKENPVAVFFLIFIIHTTKILFSKTLCFAYNFWDSNVHFRPIWRWYIINTFVIIFFLSSRVEFIVHR